MKNFWFLIGTMLTSVSLFSNSYGEKKGDYDVWLLKEIKNSHLVVKACCRNNTSQEAKIFLKIISEKTGKAGKSKSFQSNEILLRAKEEKCTSQIALNLTSDDDYRIILEAYKNGELIATDSIKKELKSDESI